MPSLEEALLLGNKRPSSSTQRPTSKTSETFLLLETYNISLQASTRPFHSCSVDLKPWYYSYWSFCDTLFPSTTWQLQALLKKQSKICKENTKIFLAHSHTFIYRLGWAWDNLSEIMYLWIAGINGNFQLTSMNYSFVCLMKVGVPFVASDLRCTFKNLIQLICT